MGDSYQENMLPKFHALPGHKVSLQTFDKDGRVNYIDKATSYTNEYGIPVTRLEYKKQLNLTKMKHFIGTYDTLTITNPEILFIHGCQFLYMDIVVKYLQNHKDIKVYIDNHTGFSNSASN